MKPICSLFFLLGFALNAYSQDYSSFVAQANVHHQNQEYIQAMVQYLEAFKLEKDNAGDLFNAACSAAMAGKTKQAFNWLEDALQKGWKNIYRLRFEPDLKSLHNFNKWNTMVSDLQAEIDKIEAAYDKTLQAHLMSIYEKEQFARNAYDDAALRYGNKHLVTDSLRAQMEQVYGQNLQSIKTMLDTTGWVGSDLVGEKAARVPFLIMQNADLATQQQYLPMMRTAVTEGRAFAADLAVLEDLVALGEGKKQTYGTQVAIDPQTATHYLRPLEDPDNVDERRKAVGLVPMAEYLQQYKLKWDAEAYKQLLPKIELMERARK